MLRGRVTRRAASSMAGQRRVAPGLAPNDGRFSLLLLQVQSDQAKEKKDICQSLEQKGKSHINHV